MSHKIKYSLGFLLFATFLASIYLFKSSDDIISNDTQEQSLSARKAIEYTEKLVIEKKPAPTESSLAYAYAATTYFNVLKETGNKVTAEKASKYISEKILGATSTVENDLNSSVLDDMLKRLNNDGHLKTSLGYSMPKGDWVWVDRDTSPRTPFTPNAGTWERWVVKGISFEVPQPPKYKSEEYLQALEQVRVASENRTPEQGAAVNFWGGIPGTAQPAGIWLDQLFNYSKKYDLTNEEYAYVQMVLAQTLFDAFVECWKVKFTYWTKRPDMAINTIDTAMPNPPFPSYLSGHSTISFAAATVLAKFFPKDAEKYLSNAEEAKNSRLWAGIHFPYDNEQGKKLGIKIGESVIEKLQVEAIGK